MKCDVKKKEKKKSCIDAHNIAYFIHRDNLVLNSETRILIYFYIYVYIQEGDSEMCKDIDNVELISSSFFFSLYSLSVASFVDIEQLIQKYYYQKVW